MKKVLLLVIAISFLLFGCDKDEEPEVFTANATLLIDSAEVDNCRYSLQTSDHQYFAVEQLPQELQDGTVNVAIKYTRTGGFIDCGFSGELPEIEILDLKIRD